MLLLLCTVPNTKKDLKMKKLIFLLLLGFTINAHAQEAGEKLFKAVINKDLASVKKIVQKDSALVNYVRKINQSFFIPVLMQAVMNNETEIAKLFILKGADVNKQDGFKMTCLMWAASNQNLELVKLLLEKGADKNVKDHQGMTALKAAEETKNAEIIDLLK